MDLWVTVSADQLRVCLARVLAGEPVRIGLKGSDGTPIAALSLADLEYLTDPDAAALEPVRP